MLEASGWYHPRCHRVLGQMRSKIRAAVDRANRAERASATDRADAATTRVRNMELDTEATVLRMKLKNAENEVRQLRERLTAEHANNRRDREERETSVRRHAELLSENDALRNELQSHRALSGQAPAASATTKDPPKVAEDGRDPAVIRAELLELD